MQQQSFIKKLFERRVPQIFGLYVAATWMMIEIGDWIVDRFQLQPELTSYIFIGMLFFVPSVCYLAYQYGQPGPDPWKKPTFVVVPVNLAIAIMAMFYFVTPVDATETKLVTDEKGQQRQFEVAKENFKKSAIHFFWRNLSEKADHDWLQYGLPWLLSEDLNRSIFIQSDTPFQNRELISKIKDAGFENALKVPRSLQLKLSRENYTQYVIDGWFDEKNGEFTLNLDVILASTGEVVATHQVAGDNYFNLIDELTLSIKETFQIPDTLSERANDLPVIEHTSESEAAIKNRIQSDIALYFSNDYEAAKQYLESAVSEDFSFAEAYARLARINQLIGNSEEAMRAINQAQKHEYKFTPQDQFMLKAIAYAIRGDYVSQVKVYEMWIAVEPENVEAREQIARILLVTGLDHDKTLTHLQKVRELKPDDLSVLRDLARAYLLKGERDNATKTLNHYITEKPNDVEVLIQLADIYSRSGQLEQANEMIEKVRLLERENTGALILSAVVLVKKGEFEAAELMLKENIDSAQSNADKLPLMGALLGVYSIQGQIHKSLQLSDEMILISDHLPPLLKIFQVQFPRVLYLSSLSQFDEASSLIEELKSQVQPPLDSVVDIGGLNITLLRKDIEATEILVNDLEKFLTKYPNPLFDSIVLQAKAEVASLKGEHEQAAQLHQSSLNSIEKNTISEQGEELVLMQKTKLALALIDAQQYQKALEQLQAVIRQHPYFPTAHIALGNYYIAKGNLEKANKAAEQVKLIWKNADKDYTDYQLLEDLEAKLLAAQ